MKTRYPCKMRTEILKFQPKTAFLHISDKYRLEISNISSKIIKVLATNESEMGSQSTSHSSDVKVKIIYSLDNFQLQFSFQDKPFLTGLAFRQFEVDLDSGLNHYLLHTTETYYGLGEKTGSSLILNQKSYKIATSDAMGFNAERCFYWPCCGSA